MKVRTIKNFDFKTHETLYGVSIKVDRGRLYCKYPIGDQGYKTIADANDAKEDVIEKLSNGYILYFGKKWECRS